MKKAMICLCALYICLSMAACSPFFPRRYPVDVDYDVDYSDTIKLYSDQDWIYEDYEYYYRKFDNIDYNVRVPFINIDSYDAEVANREIIRLVDKKIEEVNGTDGWYDEVGAYFEFNYTTYISNNIAAVIIKTGIEATDIMLPDYYTYTFNINTGYILSYSDACEMAGFSSVSLERTIEEIVTETLKKEIHEAYGADSPYLEYVEETMSNYHQAVKTGEIGFVIDEYRTTLKVIFTWSIPFHAGYKNEIIDIWY